MDMSFLEAFDSFLLYLITFIKKIFYFSHHNHAEKLECSPKSNTRTLEKLSIIKQSQYIPQVSMKKSILFYSLLSRYICFVSIKFSLHRVFRSNCSSQKFVFAWCIDNNNFIIVVQMKKYTQTKRRGTIVFCKFISKGMIDEIY